LSLGEAHNDEREKQKAFFWAGCLQTSEANKY
jgi:hypothetical protein